MVLTASWSLPPWSPLAPLKLPRNSSAANRSSFLARAHSSMAQLNQPLVSNLPSFSALSSINLVSTRLPQANPRPLVHRLVSNSAITPPPIATATGLGFNASSSFGLLGGLTWSSPWSPLVPLKLPRNKLCRKISSFLARVPSSLA